MTMTSVWKAKTFRDESLTHRLNKNIRSTGSRTKPNNTLTFSFLFTITCASLICFLSLIGIGSAQGVRDLLSFHSENGEIRHRMRRMNVEFPKPFGPSGVTDITPFKSEQSANVGNVHKPNFADCSTYSPEIYEEQPPETFVIQVVATDRDPYDIGGKVIYSIIDATDSFTVDSETGIVRTRKAFNRDEPQNEREKYVTIRGTDNGRPELEAICTIKVIVKDVNDNSPIFDKYEFVERVPQDAELNKVVTKISATDIDDGKNGTVIYRLEPHSNSPSDISYFSIVPVTGELILEQGLQDMYIKPKYFLQVVANDRGSNSMSSLTNITIDVVEANRKPPSIENHQRHFSLPETTTGQGHTFLVLKADSNTPDGNVFFEILNGPTESSNKDNHFTIEADGNKASLKLDTSLDFESVAKYTLTIRVSNKYNLATETLVTVEVEDQNDIKPTFIEIGSGSILENEPIGSYVTKIRAVDNDGTSPNNLVKYYLKDEDNFRIDETTGEIFSLKEFNREAQEIYQVKVVAKDSAPSVLTTDGLPNNRTVTLKIEIKDKNDNAPQFVKPKYEAQVLENANVMVKVMEIRAEDKDTASEITYSIVSGDPDNYFHIESTKSGGLIMIKKPLDFEKIQKYDLKVKASDSVYETFTKVIIYVENVNDERPVFITKNTNLTIMEETLPPGCIFIAEAYDPDLQDRSMPQNIVYSLQKGDLNFRIDNKGCVTVTNKLDRDPGTGGFPHPQIIVGAFDEGGNTATRQSSFLDLSITLIDQNDNKPFLNSSNPVVWYENQPSGGIITYLSAGDFDEPRNGAPFHFSIDPKADSHIKSIFQISGNVLSTPKAMFDRETTKEYLVPIVITDAGTPQLTGISVLTVIIGDENDNPMEPGDSKIFMYKYKDTKPVTIGRVYVKDPDDWDLPDKTFSWRNEAHYLFKLHEFDGNIDAMPSVSEGTYRLEFKVYDDRHKQTVDANVDVIVRQITDEAVDNSGSIRFYGITKEDFIKRGSDGRSKQDILRTEIARILGIENEDNVDVFTVLNSPHTNDPLILDVRYSAHNSPYYKAEKLDGKLAENKAELERALELSIMLIRVDECLQEKGHGCESGCTNFLFKSDSSYKIYTNTTSFVGVEAYIDPLCNCAVTLAPTSCADNPCLYGGRCMSGAGIDGFICECEDGFKGKRCEVSSIHFDGSTWAWFPPIHVCNNSVLEVYFEAKSSNALIMYNGPTFKPTVNVTDFMSLELLGGRPRLLMDFGSGVRDLRVPSKDLGDSNEHLITIRWTQTEISMSVDGCPYKNPDCYAFAGPVGTHEFLNVNGPLQLGGMSFDVQKLKSVMPWIHFPTMEKFSGCITNLSLNGQFYNLREPSHASGNVTTCELYPNLDLVGVHLSPLFIIIIIVCFLILVILILSVIFYRRRKVYEEIKTDPGDDIRENVMKYDDDGGGEGDANFNLALLGRPYPQSPTEKIPLERLYPVGRSIYYPDEPDMQSFVQGNKDRMDRDPDGLPFDDVRNYAYEGDGNSLGSLSSLASGTDDEDLNFDYLPSFGPRFKKLADMYGGNSSDDSSIYSGA